MDLLSKLENEHSKHSSLAIVNWVASDQDRFKLLFQLFISSDYRICQRASWPIGMLADRQPELFVPFLESMIKNLDNPIHDAVIRNTVRVLGSLDIPEDLQGDVYEKLMNYLQLKEYPVAIKVFSMTVLANIALKYPELKQELVSLIEIQYPTGSAGFKARARRELKRLKS